MRSSEARKENGEEKKEETMEGRLYEALAFYVDVRKRDW